MFPSTFIGHYELCGSAQLLAKWEQVNIIYSEPARARVSATIICICQRLKGRQESEKALCWKKEVFSSPVPIGGCWAGEAGGELTNSQHPIWLVSGPYLVGPKLDAGAQIREAVTYWLNPGCFGPMATEVVVWVSGLVAADFGLEFYFYVWSGHFLLVYLVSQLLFYFCCLYFC